MSHYRHSPVEKRSCEKNINFDVWVSVEIPIISPAIALGIFNPQKLIISNNDEEDKERDRNGRKNDDSVPAWKLTASSCCINLSIYSFRHHDVVSGNFSADHKCSIKSAICFLQE